MFHAKEGKKTVFTIAKQMVNERKEFIGVNCLKFELVELDGMMQRIERLYGAVAKYRE